MPDSVLPTVITVARRAEAPPWRVGSLAVPALFGGPLAVTLLGLVNGRRLRATPAAQLAVAAAGLVALLAQIVIGVAAGRFWLGMLSLAQSAESVAAWLALAGLQCLVGATAGMATWLAVTAFQHWPCHAYEQRGGEPGRLLLPGLGVVLGVVLVEAVAVYLAVQPAVGS